MLRQNLLPEGNNILVVDDLTELTPESLDYLFSFEVLDHIENDESALAELTRYIKHGGRLLISVPSRLHKYGKSDEIVGHVRRYEINALASMLERCGYLDIRIMCYAFPPTEITRRVTNWLVKDESAHK